jgi:hypothetical protein
MKALIVTLIFLIGLTFSIGLKAQGNLVFNGGFDVTSGNDAEGWTLTGPAFANVKNGTPAPDVNLGGVATASQTINGLNLGSIYRVSGDYLASGSDHSTISFEAMIDGVALFQTGVPTNSNWNSFVFEYTATTSSVVLTLSQIYSSNLLVDHYHIDNIAMYAVPEPSAYVLMCLISLVLTWRRFHRQRART